MIASPIKKWCQPCWITDRAHFPSALFGFHVAPRDELNPLSAASPNEKPSRDPRTSAIVC